MLSQLTVIMTSLSLSLFLSPSLANKYRNAWLVGQALEITPPPITHHPPPCTPPPSASRSTVGSKKTPRRRLRDYCDHRRNFTPNKEIVSIKRERERERERRETGLAKESVQYFDTTTTTTMTTRIKLKRRKEVVPVSSFYITLQHLLPYEYRTGSFFFFFFN